MNGDERQSADVTEAATISSATLVVVVVGWAGGSALPPPRAHPGSRSIAWRFLIWRVGLFCWGGGEAGPARADQKVVVRRGRV